MAAGVEANGYITGGVTNAIGLGAMESTMAGWLQPGTFVANMVWHQFLQLYPHGVPPLLAAFETNRSPTRVRDTARKSKLAGNGSGNELTRTLMRVTVSERLSTLEALVLKTVAIVGGQPDVGADEPLMEAGLDSLAAIELRNQLSQSLGGVGLSATILFDHPTVWQLAVHLDSLLFEVEEPQDFTVAIPLTNALAQQAPTILSGTACWLPGGSDRTATFWHFLSNAVDPICSVPSGRWDEQEYVDLGEGGAMKCYVQCGGFVVGLEGFDAGFFRISMAEVKHMDPQQRAVLEVCAQLLTVQLADNFWYCR